MPETANAAQSEPRQAPLPDVPDGWIPAKDAATICRCTEQTIRNRINCGRVRGAMCHAPGGLRYYVDPASDTDLAAAYAPTEIACTAAGRRLAELSDAQRARAADRMAAIVDWRQHRDNVAGVKAFAAWSTAYAEAHGLKRPISRTAMWRWGKAFDADGVAGLAPQRHGPTASEPSPEAWAFFHTLYLTTNKRTVRDCHEQTAAAARKKKWTWISYPRCRRKVDRDIPRATQVLYREGTTAHKDQCVPYIERDYENLKPNDWWVVDHHQLDIAAIGPNGKPAFPWITYWQDVKSRKPMGCLMSFAPNQDVVLASLRRAMLDFGVPKHAYADNGKDFLARSVTGGRKKIRVQVDETTVRAALHHLPIQVHFAQIYNAQAKPNERTFLTLRKQFSVQWPTYRGNGHENRPEGLTEILSDYENNCLIPKPKELDAALADWLATVYCKRVHGGQGMNGRCPDDVYNGELTEIVRVSEDELHLLMMRAEKPRTVGRNGVKVFGYHYNAPELFAYLGRKVHVRYDPAAIGRLVIQTLTGELLCVAARHDLLEWGAKGEDVRKRMRLKTQRRRAAESYKQTSELLTGDAIQNIALQRQATERASAEHDDPTDPAGGGESKPTIRVFRTVFAETAEQLRTGRVAAGAEHHADPGRASASAFYAIDEPVADVPDLAAPTAASPSGDDDVFDELEV